ncbi:2-oxoglutarate dehydrogenase E1 component [Pelagicoccus sp. NFK12]|uniref:2-oxoglutarate dehydrogenase E1 component n=1 Tax=Pelagicoccus enzymogenes TaxID=2773457 RepID=A0A927F8X4_9BACT|nr:2-oxoglutarate dehydrogenase E1 component [Pelagicoccus enzymogenes]MBD5780504.1 2-oxoglutarate dehydrogenase E1 component [Pelagicoccus enzymogenes]MDQ8197596.1 2-oxoglutarate dehydrogenase E1 component [Pelagicoccus enzymogenes]
MVTFATRSNADLIDLNYEKWKADPASVDEKWQAFFEGFELALTTAPAPKAPKGAAAQITSSAAKQMNVSSLIYAYRSLGHTQAKINPLDEVTPQNPNLSLEEFGLSESDLDAAFNSGHFLDGQPMKLRDLIESLKKTYCSSIGYEYIHMQNTEARRWIQSKIEPAQGSIEFSDAIKTRILRKVFAAEAFESFLHTRYTGQKRFSLEGGETLIPCLDNVLEHCGRLGIKEVVMGMAHRGRLNVLANTLKKSYEFVFEEFGEEYIPDTVGGDGDVKYHLGYEKVIETKEGHYVEIRLASNPSHLEAVNPVVEGKARARQRILNDTKRDKVLPVLIHGDAAFAGQGLVTEVLNSSQLPGYRTGGTLHIIVNNQIGFTTTPKEARSTRYCTDVAKMIEAPIFHVNGDDPLAVVYVTLLAIEYRQKFGADVVIDMYCYRKHGHNEADEPMFTNPDLYDKISKHPPVSEILTKRLIDEGTLSKEEVAKIQKEYETSLANSLDRVKKAAEAKIEVKKALAGSNAIFQPKFNFDPVETGVGRDILGTVVQGLTRLPSHIKPNRKIKRFLDTRKTAFENNEPIDWAFGEALAFGTLLNQGTPVRLSGQDSERGTFSHRHAVIHDVKSDERYIPLLNIDKDQARFCVYNSLLSEAAVLGFDFGYSLDYPRMLCIWEAQFGDFANGAQVIIDQFITSSESKWGRVSGLVMLLPHGYEGQGPEHSSARLERFLQSCAEENIQVCNMTNSAQYFHVLRRQMMREFRKPLVIMSPKSMLRLKDAASPWEDIESGSFQEILDDDKATASKTKRLILCSGKVYYDIRKKQEELKDKTTAVIRIEQLYPLHTAKLEEIAKKYSKATNLVWCQEESQNMGAYTFIAPKLEEIFKKKPAYAGRGESASPAVGVMALHKKELAQLLEDAFTL